MSKNLLSEIKSKKIISIYGLGNVGGPIAAAWLRNGAKIIGVDISQTLISNIKKGVSHKKEPYISKILTKALKNGKLKLSLDGIDASKKSDIKFVAVPVGLKGKKIDLSALFSAITSISKGLKKGDAVIICPSLPPRTTEMAVKKILEHNSKLKAEKDFYLIYNPERIFEGRALADIEENYPSIISGYGPKSLEFADELLKIISKKGTLKMSSLANAEAEKLFEGVYRDVNIALANELAGFCENMGINYWEVMKSANSQPYCHLHYPGTGVGGLCIPIYPQFVINDARKMGKPLKILENARKMNDHMPQKCVKKSLELLSKNHITIKGAKIAILGLGFRGEVDDSRLSPTYEVIKEFLKVGCKITVHDPYIKEDNNLPSNVILSDNLEKIIKNTSLIFISTDHKAYSELNKKSFLKANMPLLIFDGRNILNKKNFVKSSIFTIGIP